MVLVDDDNVFCSAGLVRWLDWDGKDIAGEGETSKEGDVSEKSHIDALQY